MSNYSKLYIAGMGMITPIGAHTAMTAAAVRAEMSSNKESNFFDQDFNNVTIATIPDEALENSLEEDALTGPMNAHQARMLQIAKLAMLELMPQLPVGEKLPLFLAAPEPLVSIDPTLSMTFIQNLALQTGANFDLAQCRINAVGRAGVLDSIKLAFRFFESTNAKWVLVGGVDSFYDKEVLNFLLSKERLLCGEVMDGFIPGEGAAFLLLTNQPTASLSSKFPIVFEPGQGTEKGHRYSQITYTGDGLATAVSTAIENAAIPKIKTLYSSMNGESFFAKEHGVAMIRNSDAFDENIKIEHPADCYGDLGAATGAVMLGIAASNIQSGKIMSPCLVCCSSDREHRSAVVIS